MGTLPSDEASDRLILNLEGFEEPPTFKQWKYIKDLEVRHGVKFVGKTKAEASEFISEVCGYSSDDYFD